VADPVECPPQGVGVACVTDQKAIRRDRVQNFVRGLRTGQNCGRAVLGGKLGDDVRSDETATDDEYT